MAHKKTSKKSTPIPKKSPAPWKKYGMTKEAWDAMNSESIMNPKKK